MTFFKKVASFAGTVEASTDVDTIIKVASESGVSRNDIIVHHNLTEGNVFTGENLVKVAEDEEPSRLLVAVEAYEKLASGEIDDELAMSMITEVGLTSEDFNEIADLIDKQASEAGVVASGAVWEKVAEAHDFLSEAGLDPVASMEFAEAFSAADGEEAQDKVASEYEGLDEESIDKIAKAFEYLGDIEGVDVSVLMEEYSKEASKQGMAAKASKLGKKIYDDVTGKSLKAAKEAAKPKPYNIFNKKKVMAEMDAAKKNVETVEKATKRARLGLGAGVGVGALAGGAALSKQASEIEAEDAVWEKVAEAHDFLSEAGLDPVASMEFAEAFSAADGEEAQDKVASEYEGLDEESIDKIAKAFEYLGDIEGVDVSVLMEEYSKEAGAKKIGETVLNAARAFGKDVSDKTSKASKLGKKFYDDVTGKSVKAAKEKAKILGSKEQAKANIEAAKKATVRARLGLGAGVGATALGASMLSRGRD